MAKTPDSQLCMCRLVDPYCPPECAEVCLDPFDDEYPVITAVEVFVVGVLLAKLVGGTMVRPGMDTQAFMHTLANGIYPFQVS